MHASAAIKLKYRIEQRDEIKVDNKIKQLQNMSLTVALGLRIITGRSQLTNLLQLNEMQVESSVRSSSLQIKSLKEAAEN